MIAIKRILALTDCSEPSSDALLYAWVVCLIASSNIIGEKGFILEVTCYLGCCVSCLYFNCYCK